DPTLGRAGRDRAARRRRGGPRRRRARRTGGGHRGRGGRRARAHRTRAPIEGGRPVIAGPAMAQGTPFDGRLVEVATRIAVGRARRRRREASVLLVALLLALVATTASLLLGAAGLTVGDVLAALVGQGSPKAEFVIIRLRL